MSSLSCICIVHRKCRREATSRVRSGVAAVGRVSREEGRRERHEGGSKGERTGTTMTGEQWDGRLIRLVCDSLAPFPRQISSPLLSSHLIMSAAASSSSVFPAPSPRLRVGIAGATGVVGQRFISLLSAHPWFELVLLSASERSAGKKFAEIATWKLTTDMPTLVADMEVYATTVEVYKSHSVSLVFSALDASIAGEIESEFARAGLKVFSNARNHRMDPQVPILIPHANSQHIDIIAQQRKTEGYGEKGGFIITNANCSSTGLVVALKVTITNKQ